MLSDCRRLVPVLLSISASPSSLSVRDALFCGNAPKRLSCSVCHVAKQRTHMYLNPVGRLQV